MAHQMTSQLPATRKRSGDVSSAVMNGLAKLQTVPEGQDAANATKAATPAGNLPLLSASTLCCLSGTISATLHWGCSQTIPCWEVASRSCGCALAAQRARSTATLHSQAGGPAQSLLAAPFARADKPANATPCKTSTQAWPHNGITTGTKAGDYTAHSQYMAWWRSSQGHSWQQSITRRTSAMQIGCNRKHAKEHGL